MADAAFLSKIHKSNMQDIDPHLLHIFDAHDAKTKHLYTLNFFCAVPLMTQLNLLTVTLMLLSNNVTALDSQLPSLISLFIFV